ERIVESMCHSLCGAAGPRVQVVRHLLTLGVALTMFQSAALAQNGIGEGDAGACTLKNHIYTCDGAALQKALTGATTIGLETHNADGVARNALTDLVANKLHKTVAPNGAPADLVILLEPIDQSGQVEAGTSLQDLATHRVYSATPDGRPAHLLWAETYSGDPSNHDLP